MKRYLFLALLASLTFSSPLYATRFRMLDAKGLGVAASQYGAMGFKGKILKIENVEGDRRITILVQDVLRGDIKEGQTIVLNFPGPSAPNQLSYVKTFKIPLPSSLNVGDTTVLFVSRNMFGKNFLIGGEQGQFFVTQQNGKEYIYNRFNNQNIFSTNASKSPLMKQVMGDMYERNSGTISITDFKKLMNE